MFKPPNSNQLGKVDEGKFNFPTSSSPKGEGVGELNFSSCFSDFEFILNEAWDETLRRNPTSFDFDFWGYRYGTLYWIQEKDVKYFFDQFLRQVEKELMKMGFNSWVPELYSKFGRFVRIKKLETLKWGYASCLSSPNPKQALSNEVLPKVWEKGLEFQKSLTLAKIDKIDDLVSKKFLDSFNLDYREFKHFKYDISKSAWEIELKACAKTLELVKLPESSIPTPKFVDYNVLTSEGDFLQKPFHVLASIRENTFYPAVSYVLKERVEKKVLYRNLMEFLFFFYEFDIGKPIFFLSVFLYLEDLLYNLYEFNISKFLSW